MNDNSCPVDRALTNIESYAKEPSEALQGLLVMKRIIANITTHPNEDKFKIISKKNEVLSKQVFNLRGMHELLKVLGFEEVRKVFGLVIFSTYFWFLTKKIIFSIEKWALQASRRWWKDQVSRGRY